MRLIRLMTLFLFSVLFGNAQNALPIISASSSLVDIRDGGDFYKGEWTLAPEAKPDVYTSNKVGEAITFYTDLDSISFVLTKEEEFDFIILLNGQDSAYTQIKYEPSYLDVLKSAEAYNENDQFSIPAFTYQDSSELVLKTLRKELKLDSIAGGGNEVSKILNLMHWIHDLIPHDGNHENPIVKNAMSLIQECKIGKRGLNCRGLATVLNECYLSLGIKSRFVTCMPKDSVFNDCHVINMVYSKELEKWVWIDPTHDAYIMDDQGVLLGLEEVREKLINGEMIILNPDANWNNKFSTLKENYLYQYMAKNLYRFECPLNSEHDYETHFEGKKVEYVELLPLDGYQQKPKSSERTIEKSGVIFKRFKTNNPNIFWAAPK